MGQWTAWPCRRTPTPGPPRPAPRSRPGAGSRSVARSVRSAGGTRSSSSRCSTRSTPSAATSSRPTPRPAFSHAADIISIEKTLGIFHELGANRWLADHRPLAVVANYIYATLHFIVTILVGAWVLWKHPRHARSLRIAWYSTNLVALIGFAVYPLAPPRLVPAYGFVDTVVRFGTWGSWGKHGVDQVSNQFAAMPSLHIGWSTWCAIVVCTLATRWWVKALAVLYPVLILGVIIGTANHYFLDAVFGLVTLSIGFAIQRLITGHRAFASPPLLPRGAAPAQEMPAPVA